MLSPADGAVRATRTHLSARPLSLLPPKRKCASVTSVVYLLGSLGVGKRTVGLALSERTGAICIDNQTVNIPVIGLFGWDGKSSLPGRIWPYIDTIRDAMLSALEHLAPPHLSYVLTNALQADRAGEDLFQRIERIAQRRGATFAPVVLTCDRSEQLRRVASQDRVDRLKLSDPVEAETLIESSAFYVPSNPNTLTLNTTSLRPVDAARAITAHVDKLTLL